MQQTIHKTELKLSRSIVRAQIAIVQFLFLCPVAIMLFHRDFSFAVDYFSLLGIFRSFLTPHAWVFNTSLVVLGGGLFQMFFELYRAKINDMDDLLICASFGMAASVSLALVGLFPLNLPGLHQMVMCLWLLFTVGAVVFWLDWQRLRNSGGIKAPIGRPAVVAICIYPIAVMAGRGPAAQKVIVLFSLAWTWYLCMQLRRIIQSGEIQHWLKTKRETIEQPVKVRYIDNPFDND